MYIYCHLINCKNCEKWFYTIQKHQKLKMMFKTTILMMMRGRVCILWWNPERSISSGFQSCLTSLQRLDSQKNTISKNSLKVKCSRFNKSVKMMLMMRIRLRYISCWQEVMKVQSSRDFSRRPKTLKHLEADPTP